MLLCVDEMDGKFLWQYSCEKLPTGRLHDMPNQGICSSPFIQEDRLWMVTNRCEIVCLDTLGFIDRENDGPFTSEANENTNEADIVWKFDMMGELNVSPHNMSTCSITGNGDLLFVSTSQGVDESHLNVSDPTAPSLICMNKHTGKIVWTDNTPGKNILHAQWSSPTFAMLGGHEQVLFGAGDGWLYSFDPRGDGNKSKLLWKFDCNPKDSIYQNVLAEINLGSACYTTPIVANDTIFICIRNELFAIRL